MESRTENGVEIAEQEGKPVLLLRGTVDLFLTGDLYQAALSLLERGEDASVCCENVGHLDTSALQILLALKRGLTKKVKLLQLSTPSDSLRKLLALTGLDDLLGPSNH